MKKIISIILLSTLSLGSFAEGIFNTKIPQPDYVSNDWDGLNNTDDPDDDNDGINDVDDSTQFGGQSGAFTPPPIVGATDVSCGFNHCYALVIGPVYSVGSNQYGQLGLGDTTNSSSWTESPINP
jgi:alpha-tubulin suppressor-like RCC1 family protein